MPLFDFKCMSCGKQMELLVRSPDEQPVCECGSTSLERVFSPFAVSGFESDAAGCSDGSCSIPSSPCASGLCGM